MDYISGLLNIFFLKFVGSGYAATTVALTLLMRLCIAYLLTRKKARNITEGAENKTCRKLEIHNKEATECIARKNPARAVCLRNSLVKAFCDALESSPLNPETERGGIYD